MDLTSNSSSSSGSGRRRRISGAAAGGPRCQVEGCGMDLRGSKTYYCRHKVCVSHSKAPRVVVAGVHQRFCQQCSRFHHLPEFDQRKRSCRRRLAGHNQRRRKPPPVCLSSCYGQFSSFSGYGSKVGGFLLNFSNVSAVRATPKSGEWMISSSQWPDKLDVFPSGRNETQVTLPFHQEATGELNFSAWEFPQGESPGVAYSGCAVSLLSAQQWDATAASFQVIPDQKISSKDAPMVLSSNETNLHSSSWNFQRHGTSFKHSTLGFPQIAAYGESAAYGGDLGSQVGLTFSSNKRCWGDGTERSYGPSCTPMLHPC